ncbi:hypothetical protein [Dyella nitratireducens]|uniref:Uncharacterized protein n=1 Tax=Dyella nitratireducens TaxID=1849580 RepID=A0ABQ1GW54_9GAMM|nr:hypothetical protein [Dyella nitratireducens]GGA51559.1 hypothetical protein GCM10010981_46200 [Dyella nitratireducens]GLQ41688.1 hypothetical protein GCM10007902_15380 [Dyella nitratireducens]
MNTPGSISPGRSSGSPGSLWHLSTWSDYISRIMRPAKQPPVHMTRRQELLAAQERKRKEQRAHVLELLREVKEKNQHVQQDLHKLKA